MRVVVLDDQNMLIILGEDVDRYQIAAMQERFLDHLPGWNVILFTGAGEIVDLRNRPELADRAAELFGQIKEALLEVA